MGEDDVGPTVGSIPVPDNVITSQASINSGKLVPESMNVFGAKKSLNPHVEPKKKDGENYKKA